MQIEIVKKHKLMDPTLKVNVDEMYGKKLIEKGIAKEVKTEKSK